MRLHSVDQLKRGAEMRDYDKTIQMSRWMAFQRACRMLPMTAPEYEIIELAEVFGPRRVARRG